MKYAIEVKNIAKTFGSVKAVKDVFLFFSLGSRLFSKIEA